MEGTLHQAWWYRSLVSIKVRRSEVQDLSELQSGFETSLGNSMRSCLKCIHTYYIHTYYIHTHIHTTYIHTYIWLRIQLNVECLAYYYEAPGSSLISVEKMNMKESMGKKTGKERKKNQKDRRRRT